MKNDDKECEQLKFKRLMA